jgi:hypothetical protein
MHRWAWSLAASTLALCGCNQNAPVASAPPPPPPAAVDLSGLPPGAACTDKINRYQFVLSTDHQTGNVNESVFTAIERELKEAAAACAAGHNQEALNLVRASEDRHGYHV